MRKFIYRVSKKFTLLEDESKKLNFYEDPKLKGGSHFSKGDAYVDYESLDKDVEITEITKSLLSKNFLILMHQFEMKGKK